MADYPDWTRLFQLAGTEITIPINIEASDITMPVSIDAVTADLEVSITAVGVTLPISIDAATVDLDVNLVGQDVTIDFNFADQSVAVFDAAKWFAHNAAQVFLTAYATITVNACGTVIDYTVPAGKTLYIVGVSYSAASGETPPLSCRGDLLIAATWVLTLGSLVGAGLPLDTPVRATAGQHVYLQLCQYGAGANMVMYGSIWGYLEDV